MKVSVASPLTMLICGLAGLFPVAAAELTITNPAPAMRIVVDARVELLSVVFRLAGNPEYSQGRVPAYLKDMESHFGAHRDHEVVRLARTLRSQRGISYDAVMSYAVHLTDEFKPAVPFAPRPETLDSRWSAADAARFLEKLQRFVEDSRFRDFFKEHAPLYAQAVSRMQTVAFQDGHVDWFDRFFGTRPGARFTVALGLLNGGACYGARLQTARDREDLYCILGVWATDAAGAPQFDKTMLGTVVHEFGHAYVNPLVYRNEQPLKKSGQMLYGYVADEMKRQAYGNWQTMLHESVVRASVVRYLRAHEGEAAAQEETRRQVERHFHWTPQLVELLGDYEAHRERYPDLAAFFPRIIEFFDTYAPTFSRQMDERNRQAPRVVSLTPESGATNVNPNLEAISVTFDRPMKGGYSFVGGGPNYPETLGRPAFDAALKTVTLKVKLKPDWRYEFWLNRGNFTGFQSAEGVPLPSVHVEFRTGSKP